MASVLQTAFSLPAFKARYQSSSQHFQTCQVVAPADCLECQLLKLSEGLESGRYSHPAKLPAEPSTAIEHQLSADNQDARRFQEGIKPSMLKNLIGKGHEEFATMRQQDAEEFLQHFIQKVEQEAKKRGTSPHDEATRVFEFEMEQRLTCPECNGVRYKTDQAQSLSVPVPCKEIPSEVTGDSVKTYEPVTFETCVDLATATETLEYHCPHCAKSVAALK